MKPMSAHRFGLPKETTTPNTRHRFWWNMSYAQQAMVMKYQPMFLEFVVESSRKEWVSYQYIEQP